MVLSVYCKQRTVQLYFERRISYERGAQVLAEEGFWLPKQTVHGTISRLPGSDRPFKPTCKMLEAIEEKMKQDNETTVTQLVRMLEGVDGRSQRAQNLVHNPPNDCNTECNCNEN